MKIFYKFQKLTNEVTENIEDFQFNKSIAKIYEYVNKINEATSKELLNKDDFNWSLKRLVRYYSAFHTTY